MNKERKEISFTILNAGEEIHVKTYEHQYRNLMVLLNNNIYLENFGECGGQGRCATCLVKVIGLSPETSNMERNEKNTIQKAGLSGTNIRLSCQLLVTRELHETCVHITQDGY